MQVKEMALAMAWHISHHFHRPTSWLTVMVYLMTDCYDLHHDWQLWPTSWLTAMTYSMADCYGLPHGWMLWPTSRLKARSTSWLSTMIYLMANSYGLPHGWLLWTTSQLTARPTSWLTAITSTHSHSAPNLHLKKTQGIIWEQKRNMTRTQL